MPPAQTGPTAVAESSASESESKYSIPAEKSNVAMPPTTVPIRFTKLFINGQWVDSIHKKMLPVVNPTTGDEIASVCEADAADVDVAVRAARAAFEGPWSQLTPTERAAFMFKLADLMERHHDELAALEAMDNGKTFYIAKVFDITECIRTFRYFAGWATKIQGKTIQPDGPYAARTRHEPMGVVGAIVPWNFPLLMATWKLAPCLACGNTVVIKSSEKTPLTLLFLADLTRQAGFPPGVVNVLSGFGPTCGEPLARHMDVDKVAFTGSTAVGKKILICSAESNLKKVTVELGGKSPAIVFPDCDLDLTVEGIHMGIFFNHGQTCCASSRVFVHESIYDEFVKRAADRAKALPVSKNSNTGGALGPIVDSIQLKRVWGYIEQGKQGGAKVVAGGSRPDGNGYYVNPTVFADVTDDMTIAKEEIFGPVMSVLKFKTIEEVVQRANASQYGLSASIWTNDIMKANYLARAIKAGTVWVNCHNFLSPAIPFGGYKQSGFGRDLGEYALNEYTQVKAVITKIQLDPAKLKININQ